MRLSKFSLTAIIAGFALTFLLAGSLSAKERGWYAHGGVSYWNVDLWEKEGYVSYRSLPGFSTTGWRKDGSANQLSVGIGYNINKNWAIEVTAMWLPDLIIPGSHWLIPPLEPDDEPVSASWEVSMTDGNFLAMSVIYDLYLSERVSLFFKAGVGSSSHGWKLENSLTGSHRVLLDEQVPIMTPLFPDETSLLAVGMRMPLFHYTNVSITFAYQFVRKRAVTRLGKRDEEADPLNQLTFRYGTVKTSTFEIGIQLRM
ncbi:MAG: porin family protein [Gammaproteobacteria bacterium]|nr:porin family protein [Gammaproteobacteria bacterium]